MDEGKIFQEVYELLNEFPQKDLNKIPVSIFLKINDKRNRNHKFDYDFDKHIYEQNVNEYTIKVLVEICKKYIYTGAQNEFLNKLEEMQNKVND